MNYHVLLWIYFINLIFVINHEMDSAYWHEWKLFKIPGDITFFLIIHFPLWFVALYGLLEVYQQTFTGLIISLFMGIVGVAAFFIHGYFLKKGHEEFKTPISLFILISAFVLSLVQLIISVNLLAGLS